MKISNLVRRFKELLLSNIKTRQQFSLLEQSHFRVIDDRSHILDQTSWISIMQCRPFFICYLHFWQWIEKKFKDRVIVPENPVYIFFVAIMILNVWF